MTFAPLSSPAIVLARACLLVLLFGMPIAPLLAQSCQMRLSSNLVDFGDAQRSGAQASLGERSLSMSLSCDHPIDMTLFYRALAADGSRYAFSGKGDYGLVVRDAQLDGSPAQLGYVNNAGELPSGVASALPWVPERGLAVIGAGNTTHGRHLAAQIDVAAFTRAGLFSVRDGARWQASGRIEAPAAATSQPLDLQVNIAPGSCSPTLAGGGIVNLGSLPAASLNGSVPTPMPTREVSLNIACDAPTSFALTLQDNRRGSSTIDSDVHYGLSLDGASNKIGTYTVTTDPLRTTVDGVSSVYRTDSSTAGAAWATSHASKGMLSSSHFLGFTALAGSNTGPSPIQALSSVLAVDVTLAPTDQLDVRNVITIDGMSTLEIQYL